MSSACVYIFSTMFQLHVACVFFTYGACTMALNTVPTQISRCWKVINGIKKALHANEKSHFEIHQTVKPPHPTTLSSLQSRD